jgi:hypothetical protein
MDVRVRSFCFCARERPCDRPIPRPRNRTVSRMPSSPSGRNRNRRLLL